MNRRNLLKAFFALPAAAVAAPLAALAPKQFAMGGIVPARTSYVVGQSCCDLKIPASLIHHVEVRNYGAGPAREIERNIHRSVAAARDFQRRR